MSKSTETYTVTQLPADTGPKLKELRLSKGVMATFIAKAMGITPSHLSDLENNRRNWRPELVDKYKRALGVSNL